jgi:uncharacterized protein (DUF58 family)
MSLVSRFLDPNLVERLNNLQLAARSVTEGTTSGLHRSRLRGASVEFRQHRFYAPGDEPRRLDWRVLARTDRHYIKEYDEETNLRAHLMLDCSGSMAYGGQAAVDNAQPAGRSTKFDYAARLLAAMAYLMLGQTESVGMAMFSERPVQWLPPQSGTTQLSRLIDLLERASCEGRSSVGTAMHEAADRLDRRALVVVLSDFFVPLAQLRAGLAHLRHERHEIILMQVTDHDEVEFPFRNWTRFEGLEREEPRLAEAAMLRATYLENFQRHQHELQGICRASGAELAQFVTRQPLVESLTGFLRRRSRS